jgi:hypothetical protein
MKSVLLIAIAVALAGCAAEINEANYRPAVEYPPSPDKKQTLTGCVHEMQHETYGESVAMNAGGLIGAIGTGPSHAAHTTALIRSCMALHGWTFIGANQ